MDMYEGYHFLGMHLIWWLVWGILVFWIFAIPYKILGQRIKKESPIDLLNTRLVMGEITNVEYRKMKKLISANTKSEI